MSNEEAADVMRVSKSVVKKRMIKSMKIFGVAVERDFGIAFGMFILLLIA